jgi:hypothetical protein
VANHLPDAQPVEAVPGGSVPARGLREAKKANNQIENGFFGPAERPKLICFMDHDTLHRKVALNLSYAAALCAFREI